MCHPEPNAKPAIFAAIFALLSVLSFTTPAFAQVVSAEEIVRQLSGNPVTRSLARPGLRIVDGNEASKPASIDLYITFETASHKLSPTALEQLAQLGTALKSAALSSENISIVGHTDARGTDEYNMALSLRRAGAVRQFLNQEFGLKLERLEASGKGETQLKDRDAPASEINRRVEIVNLGH